MENIYIEPNEEIVSLIDRLISAEEKEINLIIPANAQIWQSSINLRLLKREADNLNKKITLVVPNGLDVEIAEKIGFEVKKEKDIPVETIREEQNPEFEEEVEIEEEFREAKKSKRDMIEYLVKELKPGEKLSRPFSFFKSKKKKQESSMPDFTSRIKKRKMVDIVNPSKRVKISSPYREPVEKEIPVEKMPLGGKTEILNESLSSEDENLLARQTSTHSKWPKFLAAFIIITFLIAGLVSYLILPTTEIVISPKTEEVNLDLSIVGSREISQINESLNKIPLQEIEVEKIKEREFQTTGEKQISEKAKGYITIYNEYSSDPQPLLVGTRFESPEGKIFRTIKAITVPGAKIQEGKIVSSSIKVEVVADQPGDSYNIGPTDFTIPGFKGSPKFASFYGKSENSMEGGYVGKIKVVSAEDLEEAEKRLTQEAKNEAKQAFQEQIPTDLKVIEEDLKEKAEKSSASKNEGDEAESFTLEIKVTISAFLYKEEDLKNLVDLNIASQIPDDKVVISETQQIEIDDLTIDWDKQEAFFSLSIKEKVSWKIDVQSLKKDLAGLNELDVRGYLGSLDKIQEAKVSFWPFWVKRVPFQEEKIKIIIDSAPFPE
jgi:hypothetical protein